jgi:hypothetical protein
LPSWSPACRSQACLPLLPQVHEWITSMGVENIGKRLLNSKEGKVTFDKPSMDLNTLMKYGECNSCTALDG